MEQSRYLDPQGGDGQVQSMPQAFTSWEAIYETLRAAFPKERYHMGATLVGVNDPGDGQAVSAEIEGRRRPRQRKQRPPH